MSRALQAFLAALFVTLGVCCAPAALAHTRSESHSDWQINGTHVETTVAIPEIEVKRLGPANATITNAQVAQYMQGKVTVAADGKPCANPGGAKALAATGQFRRVQYEFDCPTDKKMVLGFTGFFEIVPSHTDFAQISQAGKGFVEQLFDKDTQSIEAGAESSEDALRNAGFFKYISMGIMHIFTGVDHMSFLVGLVLLSKRTKDLLFVVTGFTIGHSCTLALAVTGILRPHAEYIDALVAFTIAMVGAENIAVQTGKPGIVAAGLGGMLILMALGKVLGLGGLPALLTLGAGIFAANYLMISGHLANAARVRLVVTLVFGLIHGFGFAAGLLEMKLPTDKLAELLFGFNIGVEIGQVSVVLAVLGVAALLIKLKLALPRRLVVDLASAALVGIGLYWFLGRAYV
ncbi:MAG: HupE/UreJ family protein [Caulobacteraceae bacterium]